MMPDAFTIHPGNFDDPRVLALLHLHMQGMRLNSPAHSFSALDLSALQDPSISFFTLWRNAALLGCGALRELSPLHGELKSMRTHPDHLRQGAARHLLAYLIDLGRARGYRTLSIETGSGPAFEPALALYRLAGFQNGPCFGHYAETGFNQFLHLEL